MKKMFVFFGIIMLAALISSQAGSPGGHGDRALERGARRGGKGLSEELGLSDEQSAELKQHTDRMREQMTALKAEHDAARTKLENLLDAETVNEAEIRRAVDEINRIAGDMLKARIETKLEIDKQLNTEQRARMREMRRDMRQRRRERIERRRERSPGKRDAATEN